MGLDMYLFKRSQRADASKGATGACGGLFPFAPSTKGKEEIGYWRKAYQVCDYILGLLGKSDVDVNCKDLRVKKAFCEQILKEAIHRVEQNEFKDEWDKSDWEDTVDIFQRALTAIDQEQAQIYFHIWY